MISLCWNYSKERRRKAKKHAQTQVMWCNALPAREAPSIYNGGLSDDLGDEVLGVEDI